MTKIRRKTRSDKFPLTLHTTGQYCKKVKGKMYYFGSEKKGRYKDIWIRQHICTGARELTETNNPALHLVLYQIANRIFC